MSIAELNALPAETPLTWRDPPPPPVVDRSENYTVVITVRMKKPLKARLDARAKQEDLSLNQLCVKALGLLCDHLDTVDAVTNETPAGEE